MKFDWIERRMNRRVVRRMSVQTRVCITCTYKITSTKTPSTIKPINDNLGIEARKPMEKKKNSKNSKRAQIRKKRITIFITILMPTEPFFVASPNLHFEPNELCSYHFQNPAQTPLPSLSAPFKASL